jgi:hypothetical protein
VGTSVEVSRKIIGTDPSVMAVVYIRLKLSGPGHVMCPLSYDAVTIHINILLDFCLWQKCKSTIGCSTYTWTHQPPIASYISLQCDVQPIGMYSLLIEIYV